MPFCTRNTDLLNWRRLLNWNTLVLKFIRLLKANLKLRGEGERKTCLVASFGTNLSGSLKYIHGVSSGAGLHRLHKPEQVFQGTRWNAGFGWVLLRVSDIRNQKQNSEGVNHGEPQRKGKSPSKTHKSVTIQFLEWSTCHFLLYPTEKLSKSKIFVKLKLLGQLSWVRSEQLQRGEKPWTFKKRSAFSTMWCWEALR